MMGVLWIEGKFSGESKYLPKTLSRYSEQTYCVNLKPRSCRFGL